MGELGWLFSFAPLSNLVKSRPNDHLSGQSEVTCASRGYQEGSVCWWWSRGSCVKRYTRRQTPLDYILVQARSDTEAIHVLGFTEKGRHHLESLKTGPSSQSIGRTLGCYDPKADQIYQLGHPSIARRKFARLIRIETLDTVYLLKVGLLKGPTRINR